MNKRALDASKLAGNKEGLYAFLIPSAPDILCSIMQIYVSRSLTEAGVKVTVRNRAFATARAFS